MTAINIGTVSGRNKEHKEGMSACRGGWINRAYL